MWQMPICTQKFQFPTAFFFYELETVFNFLLVPH